MSPTLLLIIGLVSFVVGVLGATYNMASAASDRSNRSIVSIFVVHGICALFYVGGIGSVIVSIVMYLINYTKG